MYSTLVFLPSIIDWLSCMNHFRYIDRPHDRQIYLIQIRLSYVILVEYVSKNCFGCIAIEKKSINQHDFNQFNFAQNFEKKIEWNWGASISRQNEGDTHHISLLSTENTFNTETIQSLIVIWSVIFDVHC